MAQFNLKKIIQAVKLTFKSFGEMGLRFWNRNKRTVFWTLTGVLVIFMLLPFVMVEYSKDTIDPSQMHASVPGVYTNNRLNPILDNITNIVPPKIKKLFMSKEKRNTSPREIFDKYAEARRRRMRKIYGDYEDDTRSRRDSWKKDPNEFDELWDDDYSSSARRSSSYKSDRRSYNGDKRSEFDTEDEEENARPSRRFDEYSEYLSDLPDADEKLANSDSDNNYNANPDKNAHTAASNTSGAMTAEVPSNPATKQRKTEDLLAVKQEPQSVSENRIDVPATTPSFGKMGAIINNDTFNDHLQDMRESAFSPESGHGLDSSITSSSPYSPTGNRFEPKDFDSKNFNRGEAAQKLDNMINDIATMRADARYPNLSNERDREAHDQMIRDERIREINSSNDSYIASQNALAAATTQMQTESGGQDVMDALLETPMKIDVDQLGVPLETRQRGSVIKYIPAAKWKSLAELVQSGEFEMTPERMQQMAKLREKDAQRPPVLLLFSKAKGSEGHLALKGNSIVTKEQKILAYSTSEENYIYNNRLVDLDMFYGLRGCSDKNSCYVVPNQEYSENRLPVEAAAFPFRLNGYRLEGDPEGLLRKNSAFSEQYKQKFSELATSNIAFKYYGQHKKKDRVELWRDNLDLKQDEQIPERIRILIDEDTDLDVTVARLKSKTQDVSRQVDYNLKSSTFSLLGRENTYAVTKRISEQGGYVIAGDIDTFNSFVSDLEATTPKGAEPINLPASVYSLPQSYSSYDNPKPFIRDLQTVQNRSLRKAQAEKAEELEQETSKAIIKKIKTRS